MAMTSLFETPREDLPKVKLRPYQEEAIERILEGHRQGIERGLIVMPTGTGKCLGRGTPVLMFDGAIVPVEEVAAGDLLMGPDSLPRRVVSTCSGRDMMYRIEPIKGEPYVVNSAHILSLKITGGAKLKKEFPSGSIVNIGVGAYLAETDNFRHCAKGWRAAVDFPFREVPLDAYVLGIWLGDGTKDAPHITTPDSEVVEALKAYALQHELEVVFRADAGKAATYTIRPLRPWQHGHFTTSLRGLRLMGRHSVAKHVPHLYKANSREIRLEILAGLIDSDGFLTCGGYDFISKESRLANDVAFLCRSVGLAAYVARCKKGVGGSGVKATYWRVSISGDTSMIPCRVPRRKAQERRQKKDVLSTGIRIQAIGYGEYFGFEIDGPDRLFLLGDFTVTHNTTVFSHLVGHARNWPSPNSLILAHREELLDQASRRIAHQNPGLSVAIEGGGRDAPWGTQCVVAGVATVGRSNSERLSWLNPGLTICDEGHHAPADTYMNTFRRMGCFDQRSFLLGVTATPHRLDNRPLHGTEEAIFQEVLYTYTLREAIADGWLCDLRGYRVRTDLDLTKVKTSMGDFNAGELAQAVNTESRNRQAIEHWSGVASDRRTIVFCADVDHAHAVARLFVDEGVHAEAVDGKMAMDQRGAIMERFRDGRTQVLTNVQIATEGFDVPSIACVLMLRPTQSWALYTQMVGRGLRILPMKEDCIVIDVVDNTARHSLASAPGMLGLPPGLDLQGHKLTEAVEKVEALDERHKVALFRRETSFDDITSELKEVDLLSELSVPEELSGVTKLSWVTIGDGRYKLSCGSSESERFREALLACDTLGRWTVTMRSNSRQDVWDAGMASADAFERAEGAVRTLWPDALRFLGGGQWAGEPASESQRKLLRRLRVSEGIIETLTKAKASMLITAKMEGRSGRK